MANVKFHKMKAARAWRTRRDAIGTAVFFKTGGFAERKPIDFFQTCVIEF
jgi:hypothetical protein